MINANDQVEFCPTCPRRGNCLGAVKEKDIRYRETDSAVFVSFQDKDDLASLETHLSWGDVPGAGGKENPNPEVREVVKQKLPRSILRRIGSCAGTADKCPAFTSEVVIKLAKNIATTPK